MTQSSNHDSNIQSVVKGVGDSDLFVTNDNKYSIEFLKIEEYDMLKFASNVEVCTGGESPALLFRSQTINFEYQYSKSCYYLDKSNIIVLLTPCINQNQMDLLYVLFDFNLNVFATVNAPNFTLTEIAKKLIRLDLDFRYSYDEETQEQISQDNGKQIDLIDLKWNDIKSIHKLCSLHTKNYR